MGFGLFESHGTPAPEVFAEKIFKGENWSAQNTVTWLRWEVAGRFLFCLSVDGLGPMEKVQ